jgi:outer membrane lipoprotein-sorting protein
MLPGMMLTMALLLPDNPNPIQSAVEYYQQVDTYQATIKSSSGGQSNRQDIIRYYYKKPGHVRMEVVAPVFKGAVLIYSPVTELVKLWLFGYSSFPSFNFSPENKLIQSPSGQRVDLSDLGALNQNVMALQNQGKTTVIGTESIAAQTVLHLIVEGASGFSVSGVSQFQLWLDVTTGFPLKVMSYKADGSLIELVEMSDYQINPMFPADFFDQ